MEKTPIASRPDQELNLFILAAVPFRRWRVIAVIALVVLGISAVWALTRPTVYTGETVLLPPETATGAAPVAGGLTAGLPFGLGGSSPQARLITILESRSVVDSIAARLDLATVYGRRNARQAGNIVRKNTTVISDPDGAIIVRYADQDPERVAQIANTYAVVLNEVNARLGAEAAIQRAEYLENQLLSARGELEAVEDKITEFRRGQPAVEQQQSQTLQVAADFNERILAKELEIEQLRRSVTPENPKYRAANAELVTLRAQLRRLRSGFGESSTNVLLSFAEGPALGLTYSRLLRELDKNEQIYGSLTAGLAQARIDAGDDVPVVNVLDPAIVPDNPSGPNRPLLMLLGALTGLVLGFAAAFAFDWAEVSRGRPENAPFFDAWRGFRLDTGGFVPGRVRDLVRHR